MDMIEETKEFEIIYLKSLDEKLSSSLKSFEIKSLDQELNETEETFRDLNLLIETIREMNLKQNEAINSIQSKLNEMVELKEHLKASNEFTPFLSFNKDLFGQLNLNNFTSAGLFKSKILSSNHPIQLIKLCEFNSKDTFKLLYRASQDEFASNDFHSKCDGIPNTLTILKANGFIFGGFTSATWDEAGFKSDPNAFLFSLTNKDNKPCKMKINQNQHKTAIYCSALYGPTFGDDICIGSNKTMYSYSNLSNTYQHPQYVYRSNEAKSFLAGTQRFQLSEIEVYQKE